MAKFKVFLAKDTTRYVQVEIDAESPEIAEELALSKSDQGELTWEVSDESGEPYVIETEALPSDILLEQFEREQLIELLVDANGDYSSILKKLGFKGTTTNGEVVN